MSTARRFVLSQTGLKSPAARELPRWLRFGSRCEKDREQSRTASRQETALFHQSQLQCIRVGFTLSASTPTRSSCLVLGHGVHKYSPQVGLVDILFVHHFASRSSPGAYAHNHPYLRTCLIATLSLLYHHSSSCSDNHAPIFWQDAPAGRDFAQRQRQHTSRTSTTPAVGLAHALGGGLPRWHRIWDLPQSRRAGHRRGGPSSWRCG